MSFSASRGLVPSLLFSVSFLAARAPWLLQQPAMTECHRAPQSRSQKLTRSEATGGLPDLQGGPRKAVPKSGWQQSGMVGSLEQWKEESTWRSQMLVLVLASPLMVT